MTFALVVAILARITLFITSDLLADKPRSWFVRMWPRRHWGFWNYYIECAWCISVSMVGLLSVWPLWASGFSSLEIVGTIAASSLVAGTIGNLGTGPSQYNPPKS